MIRFLVGSVLAIAIQISAVAQTPEKIATEILAPLLDPAKVATLKGDRPANSRLYKVLYWIETAQIKAGYGGSAAPLHRS